MTAKVSEEVNNCADRLMEGANLSDQGTVEFNFEKTLEGSDLTLDDFKKCQDHLTNVAMPAQGLALAKMGLDHFKNNDNAQQVTSQMPVHRDVATASFVRERTVPSTTGETKKTHGSLSLGYKARGTVGTAGPTKQVKAWASEQAKEVLAS